MSDLVKNSLSTRKRTQPDTLLPSPGNKTLVFHHESATTGPTTLDLSALVVPTSLPGYSNPSVSDLLGSKLSIYPGSMQLISSLNGVLMPDVTWRCNTVSIITFLGGYTLTSGEIITGIIRPVNTDGVLVSDARALIATGTLTSGQDTIVTDPFVINKYPSKQAGDVLVFLNGQLQMRNVGNATAVPSADGNYQEVPVAGGLTNQIKLNIAVGVDTPYVVVSNGLVAERPTNSMLAAIEAVQGKVDAMIPDLEDLTGNPPGTYGVAPTNVDLQSFGQAVLALQNWMQNIFGQYQEANLTSNFAIAAGIFDVPSVTFTLSPGTYLMSHSGTIFGGTATDTGVVVTDAANVELPQSRAAATILSVAGNGQTLTRTFRLIVTTTTTYKLRVSATFSGNTLYATGSYGTNTNSDCRMWALRLS